MSQPNMRIRRHDTHGSSTEVPATLVSEGMV